MIFKLSFLLIGALLSALCRAELPYEACFDRAAERYSVEKRLLKAIAKTESNFNPKAINQNSNQSTDIGILQINSFWLPTLAKFNIHSENLLNACVNIHIGAWILSQNIVSSQGNIWRAVGAYNAKSPDLQVIYANKVWQNYRVMD